MGGAVAAIDYMKSRLVEANADRVGRIETGETTVVGVNKFTETEESPLTAGDGGIMTVDPAVENEQIERLIEWRADRDSPTAVAALNALREAAKEGRNIMEPSIICAKAGVTTGEWGAVMRDVFGEFRAPTGVSKAVSNSAEGLDDLREAVSGLSEQLGRQVKFVVGKPGLDGHSNGAEQIAVRARDAGMDVVYEGIRLTEDDAEALRAYGVASVYTPKDFELNAIMFDLVALVSSNLPVAAE